jgi:hypothetical protein
MGQLGQIVIVAATGLGTELYRTGTADPRPLFKDNGVDGGGPLYHYSQPSLLFDIPNDPTIGQLRFYEVQRVDGEETLSLLGTASIDI